MKSYNMWSLVTRFFHLVYVFNIYVCCSMFQYLILFNCQRYFMIWIYHILFIHSSVPGTVLEAWRLSWMLLIWMFADFCVDICFLLDMYLGVKFLGHMVALRLTFWETAILFSKTAVLFQIPTAVYSCSSFSHPNQFVIFYLIASVQFW